MFNIIKKLFGNGDTARQAEPMENSAEYLRGKQDADRDTHLPPKLGSALQDPKVFEQNRLKIDQYNKGYDDRMRELGKS